MELQEAGQQGATSHGQHYRSVHFYATTHDPGISAVPTTANFRNNSKNRTKRTSNNRISNSKQPHGNINDILQSKQCQSSRG
jgi:hypothetical protein